MVTRRQGDKVSGSSGGYHAPANQASPPPWRGRARERGTPSHRAPLALILTLALWSTIALAGAPELINYQGRLDDAGGPVTGVPVAGRQRHALAVDAALVPPADRRFDPVDLTVVQPLHHPPGAAKLVGDRLAVGVARGVFLAVGPPIDAGVDWALGRDVHRSVCHLLVPYVGEPFLDPVRRRVSTRVEVAFDHLLGPGVVDVLNIRSGNCGLDNFVLFLVKGLMLLAQNI